MTAWGEASPRVRLLLVAVFLTGLTTFMFLPLLAIDLTARGIRPGVTGFLVGLLAFSSQGFSLITGVLLDQFGSSRILATGFALRIVGYVLLGSSHGRALAPLACGIVAVGVGGSLLGLAIKTMLVTEPASEPRTMLALRSTFVNVGVVLGPALGALTYRAGFRFILLACVLSHLVLGVWLARTRSPRSAGTSGPARLTPMPAGSSPEPVGPAGAGLEAVGLEAGQVGAPGTTQLSTRVRTWGRGSWLLLGVVNVGYWSIYSQLNAVVPVAVRDMTGSPSAISVVFTINGILVVLCQYLLLKRVFRRASSRTLLIIGFASFALAYAILIPEAGWWSVLCYVVPVTFAEMLIGPSLDEQVVRAAPRHRTGRAFGMMSAAAACGSLLGSGVGGSLFQALDGGGAVWLIVAAGALLAAGASAALPTMRQSHV
ncbi:MAG: MFS transporter [Jatrophihabitans sp.]